MSMQGKQDAFYVFNIFRQWLHYTLFPMPIIIDKLKSDPSLYHLPETKLNIPTAHDRRMQRYPVSKTTARIDVQHLECMAFQSIFKGRYVYYSEA